MKQWLKSSIFYQKAEKYFQTDLSYVLSGSFWIAFGQTISALLSFGMAVIFANFLPQDAYGTYKYVFSILAILSISTLPGMNFSTTQSVAKGFDGVLFPNLKTKITWGVLGSIASIVVALYYYVNTNTSLATIFLVVALVLPFMDSFTLFSSLLAGKKRFKESSLLNVTIQFFITFVTGSAVLLTNNIVFIIIANLFATTLARLIAFRTAMKRFFKREDIESSSASFGKGLSATNLVSTVANHLDSILLWHFMGPATVAVYGFALATITPAKTFFKSIVNLAHPKFATQTTENLKRTLLVKIMKGAGVILPFVLFYIFLIPYVYRFFFPQYTEAALFAQIIAITLLFIPEKLLGAAVSTRADKRTVYLLNILNSSIKIFLLLLLLPFFGIWGAVAAILAQQLFSMCISLYFFRKMKE